MDLSKLTPAPWFMELEQTKIILSSASVQRIAWVFDENHTEFMALARNAFEIMMRRGWQPKRHINGQWTVDDSCGGMNEPFRVACHLSWSDPFTAIVEAYRWYRGNVGKDK